MLGLYRCLYAVQTALFGWEQSAEVAEPLSSTGWDGHSAVGPRIAVGHLRVQSWHPAALLLTGAVMSDHFIPAVLV